MPLRIRRNETRCKPGGFHQPDRADFGAVARWRLDGAGDDIARSGGILPNFADGIFPGVTAQRFGQFLPVLALKTKMDEKLRLVSADGVAEVEQVVPDFLGRDDHVFDFWQSSQIDFQDIIMRTTSWKDMFTSLFGKRTLMEID
jgi:hypothetical protein